MAKRGDNIRKRQDGRWEGRYSVGRNSNGTIKYSSVYGKTYHQVKEKLAVIGTENKKAPICKGRDKTFAEILDLWMENNRIRLKGGTLHKYQNLIDTHIKPGLGTMKTNELDGTVINQFLNAKLESGRVDKAGSLAPSYVRSMVIIINAALDFAVREKYCYPLRTTICKPIAEAKNITILDYRTQQKLQSYLLDDITPTQAGIFISLHTGLRIGEICALTWDDIDLKQRIIHVRHTVARVYVKDGGAKPSSQWIIDSPKTKSSKRSIPISSILYPVLLQIKKVSPYRYVVSETETFLNPRTYDYRFHSILKACDIPWINYHALRHTFATRCIEAGVDVKSLSEILGHGNVSITLNTYVHSSMEMKRSQLEKLYCSSL